MSESLKCAHPDCDSYCAYNLVFLPTVHGKDAKFYCSKHKEYGQALAEDLKKKILSEQQTIFGEQTEIKTFKLINDSPPKIIKKIEVIEPRGVILEFEIENSFPDDFPDFPKKEPTIADYAVLV